MARFEEPFEEKWQDVESAGVGDYLERIEVPGGWLYRCVRIDDKGRESIAMAFVAKPVT